MYRHRILHQEARKLARRRVREVDLEGLITENRAAKTSVKGFLKLLESARVKCAEARRVEHQRRLKELTEETHDAKRGVKGFLKLLKKPQAQAQARRKAMASSTIRAADISAMMRRHRRAVYD